MAALWMARLARRRQILKPRAMQVVVVVAAAAVVRAAGCGSLTCGRCVDS
jgi:hypothetical protein